MRVESFFFEVQGGLLADGAEEVVVQDDGWLRAEQSISRLVKQAEALEKNPVLEAEILEHSEMTVLKQGKGITTRQE